MFLYSALAAITIETRTNGEWSFNKSRWFDNEQSEIYFFLPPRIGPLIYKVWGGASLLSRYPTPVNWLTYMAPPRLTWGWSKLKIMIITSSFSNQKELLMLWSKIVDKEIFCGTCTFIWIKKSSRMVLENCGIGVNVPSAISQKSTVENLHVNVRFQVATRICHTNEDDSSHFRSIDWPRTIKLRGFL